MLESECPSGKYRLHIEDGVGMNSYLGACPFVRGVSVSGLWNVVFRRAAFFPGPGGAKSLNSTDQFLQLIVVGGDAS